MDLQVQNLHLSVQPGSFSQE